MCGEDREMELGRDEVREDLRSGSRRRMFGNRDSDRTPESHHSWALYSNSSHGGGGVGSLHVALVVRVLLVLGSPGPTS